MSNQDIAQKYRAIRQEVLSTTQADFEESIPEFIGHINLTELTERAILAQENWEIPFDREIGWDWRGVRRKYRRDHMARIELAIWHDDELCGLMAGKASDGKLVMKINYIQGGEDDNPMKGYIVPISSHCAELFAVAISAEWIGIQDPLEDDELIAYYKKQGFDQKDPFDPRNNALFKHISFED